MHPVSQMSHCQDKPLVQISLRCNSWLHCAGLQEIQALGLFPKRIAMPQAPFSIFETSLGVLYFLLQMHLSVFPAFQFCNSHLHASFASQAFPPDMLNLQHS